MATKYQEAAKEVADIVTEKNKAYGDSFGKSGEVLKILYPNGIKHEEYDNLLTIVRIIDKIFRIATNKDPDGENPYQDIAGYCILKCNKKK